MVGKINATIVVTNVVKQPLKCEVQYLNPSYQTTRDRGVEMILAFTVRLLIL